MKLLICTQKVDKNDSVLGFFHRWLEEFAKHCEKLAVICLEKGEYDLPQNVKVLCLGKNIQYPISNIKFICQLRYLWQFYEYIWRERKNYDSVFVHMNPEYVVLGGWLWRLMGKKISLWYVHRQVNLKLRIAAFFANKIFSVSPESFRLKSKKVNFVGHGIDTEFFKCNVKTRESDVFKIITVGRITRIKNLDILIKAVGLLRDVVGRKFVVELVGEPVTGEDEKYLQELKNSVKIKQLDGIVRFIGSLPYHEIVNLYCQSDLLVNLCPTGGVDKVVLEAMSCGIPALVSNKAFEQYLGIMAFDLIFDYNNSVSLKGKLLFWINNCANEIVAAGGLLRGGVEKQHNLKLLISNICR